MCVQTNELQWKDSSTVKGATLGEIGWETRGKTCKANYSNVEQIRPNIARTPYPAQLRAQTSLRDIRIEPHYLFNTNF